MTLRRAAAVVTGVLSLAVTLAEVTVSPGLPNMSVFAYALHAMPTHETSTELLAFAFLVRPAPGPVLLSSLGYVLLVLRVWIHALTSRYMCAGIPLPVHLLRLVQARALQLLSAGSWAHRLLFAPG